MAAVRSWRPLVHGGRLFMAAARSWQPLVHGGHSFMAATRPWRPLVHGSLSMADVHSWWLLIHGGYLSMRNCAILKGNSSCGSCDKNHVISSHNHAGSAILTRSILYFTAEYFVWLSNRSMMMIMNEPAHIAVRQLWMGFEISGNFHSISVTFKHYFWSVICFPSKLRFVAISYQSELWLTSFILIIHHNTKVSFKFPTYGRYLEVLLLVSNLLFYKW
jgi:hypothetical protein